MCFSRYTDNGRWVSRSIALPITPAHRAPFFCCLWVISLITRTNVLAAVNFTIDDADSAVAYTPSGKWKVGQTCHSLCSAHPNPNETNAGTWHDGSHVSTDTTGPLKAEVSFVGTAVTVYGIKGFGSQATRDLTFQIDYQEVGTYSQPDTLGQGFVYHFPFFSTQGLPNVQHTLTILNGANNGPNVSLLLLDYIVYSQDEQAITTPATNPNPTSSNSSPTSSSSNGQHTSVDNQTSQASSDINPKTIAPESNSTSSTCETNLVSVTALETISSFLPSTTTVTGLPLPVSSDTSSTHSNLPIILGSVIGALGGILVILILLIWWMRRWKKTSSQLLHNNTNMGPHDAERTPTDSPSTFPFLRTRYPTIQPFHAESPLSPSAMTRKLMKIRGAKSAPSLPEATSPSSTTGALLPDVQNQMVDTAITLAAEVQRLRGENERLRLSGQMTHEAEVPPSYQQLLRSSRGSNH